MKKGKGKSKKKRKTTKKKVLKLKKKVLLIGGICLFIILLIIVWILICFKIFNKDKKEEKPKDEKLELNEVLPEVSLNSLSYTDDNYLFAGDIYYLNPYFLTTECTESEAAKDARNNPLQCMKWYEVSEDDKYITLLLNSNLAKTILINSDVTTTALKYLKESTDIWDSTLAFPKDFKENNLDYAGYNARIFSLEELEYLLENPSYTLNNFEVDYNNYISKYRPWLTENLGTNGERWINGAYFTSTKMEYFESKNYCLNREGMAFSVSDENTYGIRPIIVVEKSLLGLERTKAINSSITYLDNSVFTNKSWTNQNYIDYHFRSMRAMGINKVYVDMGSIEEKDNKIISSVVISSHKYASKFGNLTKIGKKYGIEVIPSYTIVNNMSETNQKIVLDYIESVSNDALTKGFRYETTNYYPREIHLDFNVTKENIDFYTQILEKLSFTFKNKAHISIDLPTTPDLSIEQIQKVASLVKSINLKFYNTMNIKNKTAQDYRNSIRDVLDTYYKALVDLKTELYLIGAVWEDNDNHLNFVNGKEAETLNTFIEEVKKLDSSKYTGIGFYTYSSLLNYRTNYNNSNFINNNYNYMSIRRNFLDNWTYQSK